MQVLVPYDVTDPKTRLGTVLDPSEREAFAAAMCTDVLDSIREAGHEPELLATGPVDRDCPVRVDDRPLTDAVNAVLTARTEPLTVLMADLALLTAETVTRLCETPGDVVLAPGIGGGTNAVVVRQPAFRVDYHGISYRDHRERAQACGADLSTVDSFRLSVDIDRPEDLPEVLVHGSGKSREWLRNNGFRLVERDGRMVVRREADTG